MKFTWKSVRTLLAVAFLSVGFIATAKNEVFEVEKGSIYSGKSISDLEEFSSQFENSTNPLLAFEPITELFQSCSDIYLKWGKAF